LVETHSASGFALALHVGTKGSLLKEAAAGDQVPRLPDVNPRSQHGVAVAIQKPSSMTS
jgi:hypothetical protein